MRKAKCAGCGKVAMVNLATLRVEKPGEFCAECYEKYGLDTRGDLMARLRSNSLVVEERREDDGGPWQQNAVREMERDED